MPTQGPTDRTRSKMRDYVKQQESGGEQHAMRERLRCKQ